MTRLLLAFLIALSACGAHAEDAVLLWWVDNPDIVEIDKSTVKISGLEGRGAASGLSAEYVRVSASVTDSSGNVTTEYLGVHFPTDGNEWFSEIDISNDDGPGQAGPAEANVSKYIDSSGYASVSFMIEIGNYNENDEWIVMAVSKSMELGSDASKNHIFQPNSPLYKGSTDWSGGAYAVPEPGSALLLLVGGGLLALRRRRRRA